MYFWSVKNRYAIQNVLGNIENTSTKSASRRRDYTYKTTVLIHRKKYWFDTLTYCFFLVPNWIMVVMRCNDSLQGSLE